MGNSGKGNDFLEASLQKFSQLPERTRLSAAALIASNAVPVVGILFWGWSSAGLLLTYWAESAVIGAYTVLKILMAMGKDALGEESTRINFFGKVSENLPKAILLPFFAFHFGMFMLVHLIFIIIFVFGELSLSQFIQEVPLYALAAAGMIVSHGISFKLNFLDGREYEKISPGKAMFSPYPRIIAMHFAILFGGIIGASAIILVVVKTLFDLLAHLFERASFTKAACFGTTKEASKENAKKLAKYLRSAFGIK